MKTRLFSTCFAAFGILSFMFAVSVYAANVSFPEKPITIKLESARMAPVTFPHVTHVEKNKIECAVCHHKDAKEPRACTRCHDEKEPKDKRPIAKDAYHNRCQPCHLENVEKGLKPPTKCNECHKK